ncbi:endonuclease/exonuclease/phosphatase family protein [Photobacterium galatheae]|uniref:Endonuclease n=1 Tax=Photobacterium galatheae TaxID=1654360 RepID=A0A066RV48_9GAMM|nr:endonuclease/exonuclease/phosphatase family protein [Photobacterium galatheae]KDM91243.1 endonuclease [Photobacterium galatheae]MCM0148590.1 endonuclease/exonuclease/phosphatase family protein [Photobacterium galatheae]
MLRRLIWLMGIAVILSGGGAYFSFDVPQQPELTVGSDNTHANVRCYEADSDAVIDRQGQLQVTVWNIYKEQRENWRTALDAFSQGSDIVLLQESSLTAEFQQYLRESQWQVVMANAFSFLDTQAGVMNLSRHQAKTTCAYLAMEPWLRLPKSALLAIFPLSDGTTLTVVNLHGINFAWGMDEYEGQFKALTAQLEKTKEPVLLAGDFNTWRQERMDVLTRFIEQLGLREATLEQDLRVRVLGWPLDHLFYRGMHLESAKAPATDASDHHPIIARFRLSE